MAGAALLAVVALLACGAGPAAAASVELAPSRLGSGLELTYLAAAGETNRVTVMGPVAGAIWTVEAGAPLSAIAPCLVVSAGLPPLPAGVAARCGAAGVTDAVLELADGDDEASVELGVPVELVGATGDDRLTGGGGDDGLFGQAGADALDGRGGDDLLEPGVDADVVAGGDGVDTVDYYDRAAPLAVDLEGDADDGEAGEGDRIAADVENVIGGRSDDVLRGSAAGNDLDGEAGADDIVGGPGDDVLRGGGGRDTVAGEEGADRLEGGADADALAGGVGADRIGGGGGGDTLAGADGDDELAGGEGPDVLAGGEGADVLRSLDTGPDVVACGGGVDRVDADTSDEVAADCEIVARSAPLPAPVPSIPPPPPVVGARPRDPAPRVVSEAPPASEAPTTEAGPAFEATPPGAPAPAAVARDLAAPALVVRAARRGAHLAVSLSCSEPCRIAADLLLSPRQARALRLRSRRLASRRTSGSAARFLLRVPRRARGLRATLSLRVEDAAGNRRALLRAVRL